MLNKEDLYNLVLEKREETTSELAEAIRAEITAVQTLATIDLEDDKALVEAYLAYDSCRAAMKEAKERYQAVHNI